MRAESPLLAKTGFRQRHGHAAIAYVVRGLQFSFSGKRDEQRDQPLFRRHINCGGRRR